MPEIEKKDEERLVLRVDMHCEACKAKVRKCVAGFPVWARGKKSPFSQFFSEKYKDDYSEFFQVSGPSQAGEAPATMIPPEESVVFLKVKMHCGACVRQIKECISKIHGVSDVKVDLVGEKVEVRGKDLDPKKICNWMKRKTGKTVEHVPPASPSGNPTEEKEEQNNTIEGEEEKPEESEEKNLEEANKNDIDEKKAEEEETKKSTAMMEEGESKQELGELEIKKYGITPLRSVPYAYPPQVFSDENPNACSIM